jgi:predicted O-methyltransferase YrrM
MSQTNTIRRAPARQVLDRLHNEARGDRLQFVRLVPKLITGALARKGLWQILTPETMRECYIPVSREQGELLYLTARAIGAKTIVEFGTSFGISTIYLAAAVRDNGGVAHLKEAGLEDVADVRLGDALQTLRELPEPVDMVLLDGWKDLYLPVLELVRPRLRRGAVVLADNIFTFKKSLRPYVEHMQSGKNGFESTTLKISDGFEYSVYFGQAD